MAISKKGARRIIVKDVEYLYKVSKINKKSDWRDQKDEVDETFMKYATYYGLGQVKDITINVVIQLMENPISSMFVKFQTILIDGFMGAEQITQIKPNLIAQLILKGMKDGWQPSKKGDYRMNIIEQYTKDKKPIILQLPNMNEKIDDYQNLKKPFEIKISRQSGKE